MDDEKDSEILEAPDEKEPSAEMNADEMQAAKAHKKKQRKTLLMIAVPIACILIITVILMTAHDGLKPVNPAMDTTPLDMSEPVYKLTGSYDAPIISWRSDYHPELEEESEEPEDPVHNIRIMNDKHSLEAYVEMPLDINYDNYGTELYLHTWTTPASGASGLKIYFGNRAYLDWYERGNLITDTGSLMLKADYETAMGHGWLFMERIYGQSDYMVFVIELTDNDCLIARGPETTVRKFLNHRYETLTQLMKYMFPDIESEE